MLCDKEFTASRIYCTEKRKMANEVLDKKANTMLLQKVIMTMSVLSS